MRLLEFGKEASLASVIDAIKSVPEKEVTLRIPEETPWLKNPVNEKILRKSVQQLGKMLHFEGRPEPTTTPIPEPKIPESEEVTELPTPKPSSVKDEAGFVVGGDVMANEPPQEVEEVSPAVATPTSTAPEFKVNEPTPLSGGGRFGKLGRVLSVLVRRWPFSLAAALGLLLLLGAYVVFALPKADVKIIVEQRPLEREATLTASTLVSQIDVDARKIPAQTKTSTQSGSKKATATGTKTAGTQAKGTTTIYNKTVSNKTFPAGTKITKTGSSPVLQFTLDEAVTVPAATIDAEFVVTPGKKDVGVTAAAIGPEYNLEANTVFDIVGTPSSDASGKNNSPFSGGSKRDIQVVAQADLDKLLEDLSKELTDKARQEIESQGTTDDKVIDKAMKATVTSSTYDKKVGEEASEVSLDLTSSITATVYNAQDLKEILSKTLEQAAPEGYEVSQDGIETSAELSAVEANGDLIFIGRIRANLIPKFDKDELIRNLSGKKPQAAETYLKAIPSVVSYQVNIWPNLPAALQAFPRDTKRIKIQVTVQ